MSGVFSSVRRAWSRLPRISTDTAEDLGIDEPNLHRKSIKRHSQIFLQQHSTPEERERALVIIGHDVYAGGIPAQELIIDLLPNMVTVLADANLPTSFRIQVLRTLSEVCHHNRFTIDKAWKTPRLRQTLLHAVGDLSEPRLCRWACYVISIFIADSAPILSDLDKSPRFREMLEYAADYTYHDWTGFSTNIADFLLRLLGLRPPTHQPLSSEGDTPGGSAVPATQTTPGGVTINLSQAS